MINFKNRLIILLLCIYCSILYPAELLSKQSNDDFSIDLQEVKLAEVLRILADFMHYNIIISHTVSDIISLHVHHVSAQKTFDLLLATHNLTNIPIGGAGFITLRHDWLQRETEQIKIEKMIEGSAPLTAHVWQIHYANALDVAHSIESNANSLLSKRGRIQIDSRTNIIFVQDTEKQLQQIGYFIKNIDIPVKQVLIEAHLASVDSDYEKNLGVQFSIQNTHTTISRADAIFSPTRYGVLVAKLADNSLLDMQLSAMENAGHGEVISNPRLFTANQQTAIIEAGDEIPYQHESSSGGTVVVFKKAVLSLKVTPQILPNHKVLLQLHINQDKPSKLLVHGVPAINTRQMSTSVLLKDGQTVILGGIYESNQEQAKQSIPFLGKIPLLGLLFQQNDMVENKRELLIFVTPKVIPENTG